MSDQGWNTPGQPPPPADSGGWNQPSQPAPPQDSGQAPPPPQQQPDQQWGQQPPPPQQHPPAHQQPPGQQWGQQPAPQQQQPGQQWGQQPPQGQPGQQWGQQPATSAGLDPKIAGILAYVPFTWLGGLIIYLVNKDPLSRFQGAQSILLSILAFVIFIGSTIMQIILPTGLALIFTLLNFIVWVGWFGLSVYLAIQGYNLKKTTLPVIGPIAEQWATK